MKKPLEEAKDFTQGQLAALVHHAGGKEVVQKILRGELRIKVECAHFFENGRRIPPPDLQALVCADNRDCAIRYVYADEYAERLARLAEYLPNAGLPDPTEFRDHTHLLLEGIVKNPQIPFGTLFSPYAYPYLPICLPQIQIDDLGETVKKLIDAVKRAYEDEFRGRTFVLNLRPLDFSAIQVHASSRQEVIINLMKSKPTTGLYFAGALTGYSIDAAREQMLSLLETFFLSGLDTLIALIMYPDVLMLNGHTIGLNLAGLSCYDEDHVLRVLSYGERAKIDLCEDRAIPYGYLSSGLLYTRTIY